MQAYSISRIVNIIFVVLSLWGCSNSEETTQEKSIDNISAKPTNITKDKFTVINSDSLNEFYPCSNSDVQNTQEQTWCEAKKMFNKSAYADSSSSFDSYVFGYRLGINQARLVRDKKFIINIESNKKINVEVAEVGFNNGYDTVAEAMGVIEYPPSELTDEEQNYQGLWNEAADFYQSSGFSNANPFIKQSYISGFMAGSKIAVSQDSSMANIIDPDAPQDMTSGPLFTSPKNINTQTLKAFEQGVNTGHQAMLDQIRQSLEKFTKQMFENFGDGQNNDDGQNPNLGDMNEIMEQLKQLDQQGSENSNS